MIKEIVRDDEVLSVPAEAATAEDAQVAQDLLDTMASTDGYAVMLAANQIGSNKAIIVYTGNDGRPRAMFNPKIVRAMRPQQSVEGCLSRDDETIVTRYQTITVSYDVLANGELVARQRKFTDFEAEMIQHGIDHCKGVLV